MATVCIELRTRGDETDDVTARDTKPTGFHFSARSNTILTECSPLFDSYNNIRVIRYTLHCRQTFDVQARARARGTTYIIYIYIYTAYYYYTEFTPGSMSRVNEIDLLRVFGTLYIYTRADDGNRIPGILCESAHGRWV